MELRDEEGARFLLFMHRVGLDCGPCEMWYDLIYRTAYLLDLLRTDAAGLSHFGAATWILDVLEQQGFVSCDTDSRQKILAVLGTLIGNRSPEPLQGGDRAWYPYAHPGPPLR